MDEAQAWLPAETECHEDCLFVQYSIGKCGLIVLTSTPPIDLLAMERQEIYLEMKRGIAISSENGDRKAEIKWIARERLVKKWQQRWDMGLRNDRKVDPHTYTEVEGMGGQNAGSDGILYPSDADDRTRKIQRIPKAYKEVDECRMHHFSGLTVRDTKIC